MEARELRIGNLVYDSYKSNKALYQVERIETKSYTEWNSGDDFNIVAKLVETKDSYFELNPYPIPLTEDWLLRLGFVSNPYEDRYEKGDIDVECDKTRGETFLWVSACPHIKHIHQLQNLYFALTGEELELKEL